MKVIRRVAVRRAQRQAWLRTQLAKGKYVTEIVNAAEMHPLFTRRSKQHADRRTVLSREHIKRSIYRERRQLCKDVAGDSKRALIEAYERLMLAYRMAADNDDVHNMIGAQREINRMLGLQTASVHSGFDAAMVREQMISMGAGTHGGGIRTAIA